MIIFRIIKGKGVILGKMARRNPNLTEQEIEQLLLVTEDEFNFPEDNISDNDDDEIELEGRADRAVTDEEVRRYGEEELEDLVLQAVEGRYLE